MRTKKMAFLLAAVAAVASCRSDDGGTTPPTPDAAVTGGVTVKQLLTTGALDTTVTLDNVIVVTHVSDSGDSLIFVQDPGGGAQSGIALFCDFNSQTQQCGMTRAQVDALQIGDVLQVTGKYVKVFSRIKQITTPTWTKKGSGQQPTAATVTPSMVAKDQEAAAAQWENVYVKVPGPLTVSDLMAPEFKNTSCTPPRADAGAPDAAPPTADAGPNPVYYNRGFEATASGATLAVAFNMYDTLDYCLPDCGYCKGENLLQLQTGDTYSSISGVVYFDRGGSPGVNYVGVEPTKNSDLVK